MSQSAWIFMGLVWAVIFGMTGYCFYKLLTSERQLGGDEEPPAAAETGIPKQPGD